MKIIVFDFDKTLTDQDTTLMFFIFACRGSLVRWFAIPFYFLLMILTRLKLLSVLRLKEIGLRLFCPRDLSDFNSLCREFSKTITLNGLYEEFVSSMENSDHFVIVASASFEAYLTELFKGALIIGTRLSVDRNCKISGISSHPFRDEKREILEQHGFFNIDLFYTDSKNDIFTANISKRVEWVRSGKVLTVAE